MNKFDALLVMHEILDVLRESVIISGVSLEYLGSKSPEAFQIKMKWDLDDYSRKRIQPILDKRNLKLEVMKDIVVIYSP